MIMIIQMFVCPVIIYNYFDNDVFYTMDIDEIAYLNFVALGILAFLIGIFIPIWKKRTELPDLINNLVLNKVGNSKIGILLILTGFGTSYIIPFVPPALNFFFYLMENMKFMGVFYLLFSNNRYKYLFTVGVYGLYSLHIISVGIFINLFIWGLLLLMIISFQLKLNLIQKILLFVSGVFIVFFVQSFKSEYRDEAWRSDPLELQKEVSRQEVFMDLAARRAGDTQALYEYDNINNFISRLNQGWILAKVLVHVPQREPHTHGETLINDIRSAIVPRILDPGKMESGGESGREKFTRFTGKRLVQGTRMTIGILGDAYVNFGFIGGVICMLAFGFFLNLILGFMYKLAVNYPSLILWIPFIFYYSMRSGGEFAVVLNFMTKSSLVVFIIFTLFRKHLKYKMT